MFCITPAHDDKSHVLDNEGIIKQELAASPKIGKQQKS